MASASGAGSSGSIVPGLAAAPAVRWAPPTVPLSTHAACCSRSAAAIPATAASPSTENPAVFCTEARSSGQPSSLPRLVAGRLPRRPSVPGVRSGSSPSASAHSTAVRPSAAAATASAVRTRPVAPVQETATSARVSSAGTDSIGTARAATSVSSPSIRIWARRSARSKVRLATTTSATPARASVAAAREDIEPAPMTRAFLPRAHSCMSPPCASCSRPKVTRDWPARSMPVSEWARLPTRRACWKRSFSRRPAECRSCARARESLIWPRICPSPTTIESSPQATENRWWTARSS